MENLVLIQNINTLGKKYLIVIQENWLLVFDFKHTSIELVEAATVVALWKKMFFEISHILQVNTCVACIFIKKRLQQRCFSGKFEKHLKEHLFWRRSANDCFTGVCLWLEAAMLVLKIINFLQMKKKFTFFLMEKKTWYLLKFS